MILFLSGRDRRRIWNLRREIWRNILFNIFNISKIIIAVFFIRIQMLVKIRIECIHVYIYFWCTREYIRYIEIVTIFKTKVTVTCTLNFKINIREFVCLKYVEYIANIFCIFIYKIYSFENLKLKEIWRNILLIIFNISKNIAVFLISRG